MKFDLGRLFSGSQAAPDPHVHRLAIAQLLLEIARADLRTDTQESAVIRDHLQRAFELSDAEIETLVATAASRVESAVSLYDTVKIINQHLDPETKAGLIRALWKVAYADGRLDPYEEALLRRICDLLYVPHATFVQQKLSAIQA